MLWTTLCMFPALLTAADLTWLDGPIAVPGAPAGRNPALASGGGVVHAVFRVRSGGLGSLTAPSGGSFGGAALLPGSMAAAVKGNKNYPAIAVGPAGSAHVAWAPDSGPGNGAYYQRIDPGGVPVEGVTELSALWIESISAAVADDELHVLLTAIKQDVEVDAKDGLFDVHASLDNGVFATTEAWPFPNFIEHAAVPRPGGGLALVGRWDVIKRLDLAGGAWSGFKNVSLPDGATSVGRPQLAFSGDTMLWAAIGWVDETPSTIRVRTGGPNAAWTTLAEGLFDPDGNDGEPAVALTSGPQGERVVAWLAADGPRLRVSLGMGEWAPPQQIPWTEDATTFSLIRDDDSYVVVFARADGTLMAGRLGFPEPDETTGSETTSDTGETTTGGTSTSGDVGTTTGSTGSGPEDATGGDASSGERPTEVIDSDAASTGDPPIVTATSVGLTGFGGDETSDGCACDGAAGASAGWFGLLLAGLPRRRRAVRR